MQLTQTAPYIAPPAVTQVAQPAPANPQGSVPVNTDAATAAREGQKSDPQGQQNPREGRIEVGHGSQGEKSPKPSAEEAKAKMAEQQLDQLQSRDREVRAHEEAHARVGGKHAGSPEYEFVRGSDGRMYAENGEVSIDTGKVDGDPQATIEKMETVIRAANAPMQPSSQDRRVAAQASIILSEARLELAEMEQEADPQHPKVNSEAKPSSDTSSSQNTQSYSAAPTNQHGDRESQQINRESQNRLEQNMLKRGAFQQAFPPGTVIDDRL